MAFLVGKTVGLHSPSVNRFLMFSFNDVVASEPTNINNFPYEWSSGRFKVQFAGNGRVTLYNEGEGAYVVVHSNGHVNIARRTYQQPPPNEADMQFQVVDVQGGGVALKSVPHNRHVRMSVVQTTPATGCIEFGHKVVIAQTFDHHNQCGWYGCRVAFMGSDNHMYFGHGGMDPTSFYIRPVPGSNQSLEPMDVDGTAAESVRWSTTCLSLAMSCCQLFLHPTSTQWADRQRVLRRPCGHRFHFQRWRHQQLRLVWL